MITETSHIRHIYIIYIREKYMLCVKNIFPRKEILVVFCDFSVLCACAGVL